MLRPDLAVVPIRGNIDTRLRKIALGEVDAVILAMAGLKRLGVERGAVPLDEEAWLPAPGQGALALEVRASDVRTARLLDPLDDPPTRREIEAERALLRTLGAGCQVPLAARARVTGAQLAARALVASADGARQATAAVAGVADEAVSLGRELGERLLAAGGEAILLEARRGNT
jgi:hydroxymethylbilane synthase